MGIRRFCGAIAMFVLCALSLAQHSPAQENALGVTSDKIIIGSCSATIIRQGRAVVIDDWKNLPAK